MEWLKINGFCSESLDVHRFPRWCSIKCRFCVAMDQNVCVYIYRMSVFLGIGAAQLSQQRNGGARGAPRVAKNNRETRGVVIGFTTSKIQFSDQPWKTHVPGWWLKNHLEKYESQWQGWHPILWNIIQMFQTTNQMKNTDEKHMYSSSKQIAHSPPK